LEKLICIDDALTTNAPFCAAFSFLVPPGETFGLSERQIEWLKVNHAESVRIAEQAYRTFGPATFERLVLKAKSGKFVSFESPEFKLMKLARVRTKLAARTKRKSNRLGVFEVASRKP
jgi:hypothetical protein